MIKVIVAGSRHFDNYEFVAEHLKKHLRPMQNIEIVSGGAKGVDALGERFAKENKIVLTIFRAEWDKYGRSAGYKRNAKMASYADMLIAFPYPDSKGTNMMIRLAKEKGLKVIVVKLPHRSSEL